MRLSRELVCLSVLCLAVVMVCQPSAAMKITMPDPDVGIPVLGMGGAAIGMGGAFTAIADDANAPFWNPAGLSKIQKFTFQPPSYQIAIEDNTGGEPVINVEAKNRAPAPSVTDALTWDDVFAKIPSNSGNLADLLKGMGYGTVALQATSNIAIANRGFAVFMQPLYQVGLDTRGFMYSGGEPLAGIGFANGIEHINIGISVARPIKQGGNVGLTVRSVRSTRFFEVFNVDSTGNLDSLSRSDDEKTGVALDLGYMRDVAPNATFGFMIRNAIEPQVDGTFADRQVNVGYARAMSDGKWLLAADLQDLFNDPSIHLGARYNVGRGFCLYMGLMRDKPTLGIGATLFGSKLQFAYSPDRNSIFSGSLYW